MSLLNKVFRFWNQPAAKKSHAKKAANRRRYAPLRGEALEPRTMFAIDTNDQIAEAYSFGAMTQNRAATSAVDSADDVDMFSFSVTAGQRLTFDIDRPSGSLDSFLRLFNSAGTQLSLNDDGPNPTEGASTESYLDLTFNVSGTYYLGVSGYGNQNYSAVTGAGDGNGSLGAYTLTINRVTSAPAPAPTDTDPDDALNQAVALGGMTQTRSRTDAISVATDVDTLSFTVTAGQRIAFDIDRSSGSLDSYLRIFNSAGTQLASNDDGPNPSEGSSTESYLEYTFTTGGTYYVSVSGYGNLNYNVLTGAGDANGSTGAYTLMLSVVNATPAPPPTGSGFQITLQFGSGLTASQQLIFQQAAARWSQIITGDLPSAVYNGQTIDDVLIVASASPIDGVNNILGQAGPTNLRAGSFLPFRGTMQFDTADMANMEANGTLRDVILHEMGHVLGVGTIWSNLGLLQGAGTADPRFTGRNATAAYNQIFGSTGTSVPVANVGGAGSRDSHWRESVFANELMSPSISGTPNPISRVTVGSLADMGYVVNMNAADNFTRPSGITSGANLTTSGNGGASLVAGEGFSPSMPSSLLDLLASRLADRGQATGNQGHDDHDHDHLPAPTMVIGSGAEIGSQLPISGPRSNVFTSPAVGLSRNLAVQQTQHEAAVDHLMALLGSRLNSSLHAS